MARQVIVLALIFVSIVGMTMAQAPSQSPKSSPAPKSSSPAPKSSAPAKAPAASSPNASSASAPTPSNQEISSPPAPTSEAMGSESSLDYYVPGPAPTAFADAPAISNSVSDGWNPSGAAALQASAVVATIAVASFFAF